MKFLSILTIVSFSSCLFAREPITNVDKIKNYIDLTYYGQGQNCDESNDNICLNENEYQLICKSTTGMSRNLPQLLSGFVASDESHILLKGGEFSDISVVWGKGRDGLSRCYYEFTAKGIYKGNSARQVFSGIVMQFVKNDKGKILAHYGR